MRSAVKPGPQSPAHLLGDNGASLFTSGPLKVGHSKTPCIVTDPVDNCLVFLDDSVVCALQGKQEKAQSELNTL